MPWQYHWEFWRREVDQYRPTPPEPAPPTPPQPPDIRMQRLKGTGWDWMRSQLKQQRREHLHQRRR